MLGHFLKISPLMKILEFWDWKKTMKLLQIRKLQLRYQTNYWKLKGWALSIRKQTKKGSKLRANIRWELEGKKCSRTFSKVLERQTLKSQIISELYTDDNKSKYSRNPKDIFKSEKNIYETLYTNETTSKGAITEFLAKFVTERKYLMNNLAFVRRKYI